MRKLTTLWVVIVFALTSCQKETKITSEEQSSVIAQFKELSSIILKVVKSNSEFRRHVYNECYKQKFGDYYVRLSDLVDANEISNFWDHSTHQRIQEINTKILEVDNRPLTIFIPSIENHPEKANENGAGRVSYIQEPLGALEDEYNANNYTCPGYNSNMAFVQNINEAFAWNNDVWVFGQEENCDAGNMQSAPENFTLNPDPDVSRFQGQPEYGSIIQCTNLGNIEPWVSGKLEFKMTEMNASGATILGPISLGKVKRKYFTDQRWYDYNKFIGNWNTSTFGGWMYEHWLEEDGGNSNPITVTMPPPPGTTGPTYSITVPAKNRDDNLGVTTIQFTDLITQVYNISYANIKHKN